MSKGGPDGAAIETVCKYMVEQNRPYSAGDVWNNLRQEYPKAHIIKCLDVGVERGILREKLISKQKIYFADQNKIEKCDEKMLQEMNQMITAKRNRLDELNNELKLKRNELKAYESALSTEDMAALLATLKAEVADMEERISIMEAHPKNEPVIEAKKSELISKRELYKEQYKKRKRIAESIVDTICENIETPRKKLMEYMGFELD